MINNYKTIFQKFNISKSDEAAYFHLLSDAKTMEDVEQVINHFMSKYVVPANQKLYSLIVDTLTISLSKQLTATEATQLQTTFTLSSKVYEATLAANFAMITNLILPSVVDIVGGDKFVRDQLAKQLLQNFDNRILGAMSNTRSDVLNHVRTLQREMIIRNKQYLAMKNNGVLDSIIEEEKTKFQKDMLKKYPKLEKMLKEGRVLKSRSWKDKDGIEQYRSYTLDDYTEMSVSETLKNVDRDAVEIVAKYQGDPVVEFYVADSRHVEEANWACAHIMSNCKIYGVVLLATTDYYSKLFGIWSIDRAKAENSLNIAWHCRHSIRKAPADVLNKLNKIIAIQQLTDQEV